MNPFVEQHREAIGCVLSCFDRMVITGTLPQICHARTMASYLSAREIRLFDYPRWAEPLREEIRANAERLAAEAGIEIEFVRKLKAFRKEDRVQQVLAERGDHPGLVHTFSAMETCSSYRPWHDKASGKTFFKPSSGKCIHYYFYFVDAQFGLCYVRVPTWAPFRLQVYFNGHGWLARQLTQAGMAFDIADNALLHIADPIEAQHLADSPSGVKGGAAVASGVEDGGYQETRWSNSKPGSVWAMRSQCGVGSGSSSPPGGPRAGAIGGGSVGSPRAKRIRWTRAASVTKAMMRMCAPQLGQTSGGDANSRDCSLSGSTAQR